METHGFAILDPGDRTSMRPTWDPTEWSSRLPSERLALVVLACALAGLTISGCKSSDSKAAAPGAAESSKSSVLTGEPEPAQTGFKPLKATCAEPVVRMALGSSMRPDSGSLEDVMRAFVSANREFCSPQVHYAIGGSDVEPVLLARCPDPDTANRFVRKLHNYARDVHASPMCGYAVSGWAGARRTLEVP